ncbi:MAG: ribonuclease P protein component [Candidatus Omnitrophica bacterium]|nr:ribonuclease P protein component [Candidatus Omnitrophota bacterium]
MDTRLRKVERLRKREEIRSVLRQRGLEGKYCFLHVRSNRFPYSRLGVVVSRAVGNAVVRNKTKRWLREIFRRSKSQLSRTVDLVIRAKGVVREAAYNELADEIHRLMKRQNLL